MIYTLENQHLKISLSNYGGELHSIKGKKDNTEFLWSGDEEISCSSTFPYSW